MPEKNAVDEALRIYKEAEGRNLTLRLLGGIAFRLRSPSALQDGLKRSYTDIDFVGLRKQSRALQQLFIDLGYSARSTFNKMNGDFRLIFNDIENERRVDVFLNVFQMCHKFDFSARLSADQFTLPLADLLLTKLQVYEITEREYKDVLALLKDHHLGDSDLSNTINLKYITGLCSDDWGLYTTANLNLDRLESQLDCYIPDAIVSATIKSKIQEIRTSLQIEPKSFKWKMRAKVGEKVRWYELPEPDKEIVDSRYVTERQIQSQKVS